MSQATATVQPQTAATQSSQVWRYVGVAAALLAFFGLFLLWSNMRWYETLPVEYGQRRGPEASESVNGTNVLSRLFTQAGHKVDSITRLSPRLEEYQTIVWAPDNFEPPTAEQRQYLEDWLANGIGRTLIYIGRDYNAAQQYWSDIQPLAPPEQAERVKRRLADAKAGHDAARVKMPQDEFAEWFTARSKGNRRTVKTLSGPWAADVDASQAQIVLQGALAPPAAGDVPEGSTDTAPDEVETLLDSDQGPLATRLIDEYYGDGQIIVLTNGSFVLNYPLVNHEHRKLAARLVNESSPGDVAFLESDEDGPEIVEQEPEAEIPSGLSLIKVWPLNVILLHLTMLGIVFCIARWPIFGRPKELPAESTADFGKHVTALGELLEKTKDLAYAHARLQQYQQQGKRESGKSHRK